MASVGLKEQFAKQFLLVLHKQYGRIPSAAFLAIQFNRRLDFGNGVSGETVRRWMRGSSMPEYQHLEVLTDWLKMDIAKIFNTAETSCSEKPITESTQTLDFDPTLIDNLAYLGPEQKQALFSVLKFLPDISRHILNTDHPPELIKAVA